MARTSARGPASRGSRGRMVAKAAGALLLAVCGSVAAITTGSGSALAAGNSCGNPVLATNLNGWGSLDGSWVTRDPVGDLPGASWAFDTGGRSFYMPQLSVTPGQKWTFSARDRVINGSGTAKIAVDWFGAGGVYLSQSNSAPAVSLPASTTSGGTWTLVSATYVVPASATSAHVLQFGNFGTATGTNFKATMCDYRPASDEAAVRLGWGTPDASQSDEYNATSVDLTKWGLFGAGAGQTTGCTPGHNGNGQRCASQTTQGGGFLSVAGTAAGVTGGLWARTRPFKYGRVEVRERAVPGPANNGKPYHAVPLLWPENGADYVNAEIDFAERNVGNGTVDLFVHHDGTQTHRSTVVDSTEFHNYAVDWQPDSVTWYVDGELISTVNVSIDYFSRTNGGAQLDMFPVTGTLMRPARQDVDWIRMYPNAFTQYR
ncbi:glycoside hydrolase family 16 protein [Catellatospora methionotrophica]|uniref:glycoside hydrolase family 16 protein n=1 Tax=Catellatospora methionotrophica TaxID=121620 RepID=UPI0033F19FEE